VGINNINLSHSKADIEQYLTAADSGFKSIKQFLMSEQRYPYDTKIDPVFKR
jgi:hypothetical protein